MAAQQGDPRQHPTVPPHLSLADLSAPLLDEPDALEVIQGILEDRHATVTLARSAESALATLEHESFDVLLSDIEIPNRDGYQFISEARSRG